MRPVRRRRQPRIVKRLKADIREYEAYVDDLLKLPCLADCSPQSSNASLRLMLPDNQHLALRLIIARGDRPKDHLPILVSKENSARTLQREIQSTISTHILSKLQSSPGKHTNQTFAFRWKKFWRQYCLCTCGGSETGTEKLIVERGRLGRDYNITDGSILKFRRRSSFEKKRSHGDKSKLIERRKALSRGRDY